MILFGKKKSKKIASHYNRFSEYYLKYYGDVIQAHRTTQIETLLDYLASKMSLKDNMKALDLGCGYCGPAMYFAKKFNINITCVTNSKVQFDNAARQIRENSLEQKITLMNMDYHHLDELQEEQFDLVFFLESFGHSYDRDKLLSGVYQKLKPSGYLFIKDYFSVDYKIIEDKATRKAIKKSLENIKKHYCYSAFDKEQLLKKIRKADFKICSVTEPGYELDNSEVVNGFENELGIKIFARDDFKPLNVRSYEILCQK